MSVIHIDENTPVAKLDRLAKESGLRLKWRADAPGTHREADRNSIVRFPCKAPANDGDLPPAA